MKVERLRSQLILVCNGIQDGVWEGWLVALWKFWFIKMARLVCDLADLFCRDSQAGLEE